MMRLTAAGDGHHGVAARPNVYHHHCVIARLAQRGNIASVLAGRYAAEIGDEMTKPPAIILSLRQSFRLCDGDPLRCVATGHAVFCDLLARHAFLTEIIGSRNRLLTLFLIKPRPFCLPPLCRYIQLPVQYLQLTVSSCEGFTLHG
ncbi:hypothetical protein ACKU5V_027460 [Klebsiella pneumoniae]